MYKLLLFLLCFSLEISLFGTPTESQWIRKIDAFLALQDSFDASQEARRALAAFPDSDAIKIAALRAFCRQGNEIEALHLWEKLPEEKKADNTLRETLAWGVLCKGKDSTQLPIRVMALLGAAATQDARAISYILEEMHSTLAPIRALAVHLATQFGDEPLKEQIERMFKSERIWFVRLEIIRAIGRLRMNHLRSNLKEMIAEVKTSSEERATAVTAIIEMEEKVEAEELKQLITSSRAGSRLLACELIAHADLKEHAADLIHLLQDSHPSVRVTALTTLGILELKEASGKTIDKWASELLADETPEVAITAAWLSFVHGSKRGKRKLESWLADPRPEVRRLAASALASSGERGSDLCLKVLQESGDSYVRAQVAIGLMGQRKQMQMAAAELFSFLEQNSTNLLMWDGSKHPLFPVLCPSRLRHVQDIPDYPKVADELIRLELLSLLCIVEHPKAEEAIRSCLKSDRFEVSGTAIALLLSEGGEESVDMISKLMGDPDEKVRFQAALISALFSSDSDALPILLEYYDDTDREDKMRILEAVARTGDKQAIIFLIGLFREPFHGLRVAAASALIRCLYR